MTAEERIQRLKDAMASAITCEDIKAARVILQNALEMDDEAKED